MWILDKILGNNEKKGSSHNRNPSDGWYDEDRIVVDPDDSCPGSKKGHDFNGEYLKTTQHGVTVYARPCQNQGCDAIDQQQGPPSVG